MTADVRKLEQARPSVDPTTVRILESALEDVRSGKTVGVVLIEASNDGVCHFATNGMKNRFELLGYLAHMMHKLQSKDT